MNSHLSFSLAASVLLVGAHSFLFPDNDDVTARASVNINGRPGILISSNLVYASANTEFHERRADELIVTLSANPAIRARVARVFIPVEHMNEVTLDGSVTGTPRPTTTPPVCDQQMMDECVPECLAAKDGLLSNFHTRNHALLLLEEPIPLCELEGDAVAARLDTDQYAASLLNDDSSEECFHANTIGVFPTNKLQINILRNVSMYESPSFPHCATPMVELVPEKTTNYKDEDIQSHGSHEAMQCITNEGRTLTVKGVFTVASHRRFGIRTAEYSSKLISQILDWGEFDNYINSQSKCSAFLEKYPYISVREKYLKENN